MSTSPINLEWLRQPLVDKNGMASREFSDWLRKQLVAPLAKVVTSNPNDGPIGQIQESAVISGRTEGIGTTVSGLSSNGSINAATKIVGRAEGIGTTVGQLNSSGQLLSTDEIAADGTGSPLTGARGHSRQSIPIISSPALFMEQESILPARLTVQLRFPIMEQPPRSQ